MDYQVWIKDEYEDKYTMARCGDLAAAKRLIDEAVRTGGEPILTIEVPYSLAIKVEEPGSEKSHRRETKAETEKRLKEEAEHETHQGETQPGEGPGAESQSEV